MDHADIVRAAAGAYVRSRPAARLLAELTGLGASGRGPGVLHPGAVDTGWADPQAASATAWLGTREPAALTVAPPPPGVWLGVQVTDLMGGTVLVRGSAGPAAGPLRWALERGRPGGPGTDWVRVDAVALATRTADRRAALDLVEVSGGADDPVPDPPPAGDFPAELRALLAAARPEPGSEAAGWAGLLDADPAAVVRGAVLGASLIRDALLRGSPPGARDLDRAVRACDAAQRLDPQTVLTTRVQTAGGETAHGDRAYRLELDDDHLAQGRGGWTVSTHRLRDGRPEPGPHASVAGHPGHPGGAALVQHTRPPAGADRWLRSPRGAFAVLLRRYQPTADALRGEGWAPVLQPRPEVHP